MVEIPLSTPGAPPPDKGITGPERNLQQSPDEFSIPTISETTPQPTPVQGPRIEAAPAIRSEATRPEEYNTWQQAGAKIIQDTKTNLEAINNAYSDDDTLDIASEATTEAGVQDPENARSKLEHNIWNSIALWGGDFNTQKKHLFDYISSADTGKAIDNWYSGRAGSFIKLYADDENDTSPTDENLRVAFALHSRMSSSLEGLHLFGGRDPETIAKDQKSLLWAIEVINRADSERGWGHGQASLNFLNLLEDTPQALRYWLYRIGGSLEGYFSSPINTLLTPIPIRPFMLLATGAQQFGIRAGAKLAYNLGARSTLPIAAAAVGGRIIGGAAAGFVHQASLDLLLYHPQYSKRLEELGFQPNSALESMLFSGLVGATMGGGIGLLTAPWKRINTAAEAGLRGQGLKDVTRTATDNYLQDIYNRAGGPGENANYANGTSIVSEMQRFLTTEEGQARAAEAVRDISKAYPDLISPEELSAISPDNSIAAEGAEPLTPPAEREITTRLDEVISEATSKVEMEDGAIDSRAINALLAYQRSNGLNDVGSISASPDVGGELSDWQKTVDTLDEAGRKLQASSAGDGEDKVAETKQKITKAKQQADEELVKAKAKVEAEKRLKEAGVALDLVREEYKDIANKKLKFSPQSQEVLDKLRTGESISDFTQMETLVNELQSKSSKTEKRLQSLSKKLKKQIEKIKKDEDFFKDDPKAVQAVVEGLDLLGKAVEGAERQLDLLKWTSSLANSALRTIKNPLTPTRLYQEFADLVNDWGNAIKPPKATRQISSDKPLSRKALRKINNMIKETSDQFYKEAGYLANLNELYHVNAIEAKSYGIKPTKDLQRHLDLAQNNVDLAQKTYQQITQGIQETERLAEQLEHLATTKDSSADDTIAYYQLAASLQDKANKLSLKVLQLGQANAGATRALKAAGKTPLANQYSFYTNVTPGKMGSLANPTFTDPIDAVFTQLPNVQQLLQNIAVNKRALTLLKEALIAQGSDSQTLLMDSLEVKTIGEFIDLVSTQEGSEEIVSKLKKYEQEIKEKEQALGQDLDNQYFPYKVLMDNVRALNTVRRTIGRIHNYIGKKGGVRNTAQTAPVGAIEKLLQDIFKVSIALKNFDSMDLSGAAMTHETVAYVNALGELQSYLESARFWNRGASFPIIENPSQKQQVTDSLKEYFRDSNDLELTDFTGFYTILPPDQYNDSWRYAPKSSRNPIGSLEDLGDIYNEVYMNWLTNLPIKRENVPLWSGSPVKKTIRDTIAFTKKLFGPSRDGPLDTIMRKLTDLYHRENAIINDYHGNLWLNITDKEGEALRRKTFDPEANLYFYEVLLEGRSTIKIQDPYLKYALDKLAANYIRTDAKSMDTWRRRGMPIQSLGYSYVPQTHDRIRIGAVAKRDYIDTVLPLLDLEKMHIETEAPIGIPMTQEQILQAQRNWLGAAYDNMIKDNNTDLNYERADSLGSLFTERQLHFKDAESFLKYQNAFGASTGVIQSSVDHLMVTARRQALLELFGPASGRLVEDLLDYFKGRMSEAQIKGYSTAKIGEVRNILNSLKNVKGSLTNPNLLVKTISSVDSVTIDLMLKDLFTFSIFQEPFAIMKTRQDLGLSPKGPGPLIANIFKSTGKAMENVFYYLRAPHDEFADFLARESNRRSFYEQMAYTGLIFAQDSELVSRLNVTRSSVKYPWAQNFSRRFNKVVGTDRMTLKSRHEAACYFQKDLHSMIGVPWESLPRDFRIYMERSGIREQDWGKIERTMGAVTSYVKPGTFDTRLQAQLFSPAQMSRMYGQPNTQGYDPRLADIAMKLMKAQAIYVGEGVLQSNPHLNSAVLGDKTRGLTDETQAKPYAVLVHFSLNSLRLFTTWGYTHHRTRDNYGYWAQGVGAILLAGLVLGMMQLYFKNAIRGKKFDWSDPWNYLRAAVLAGGGNYIDFLLSEMKHLFQDPDKIQTKIMGLMDKAVAPTLRTGGLTADLALSTLDWANKTPGERASAMKDYRRLHDLIVPGVVQGVSNRLLLDNFLMMMDPEAASKLFEREMKNQAIYNNAEFFPGMKPGDWTSQPLPDSLRDKEQYKEAEEKKKEHKKDRVAAERANKSKRGTVYGDEERGAQRKGAGGTQKKGVGGTQKKVSEEGRGAQRKKPNDTGGKK